MTYYEAPTRDENYVGPRVFTYLAEVDILGWKFRKMNDGRFVIDTPRAYDMEGRNMLTVLSPGQTALLQALLALELSTAAAIPDSWKDVAHNGQLEEDA